MLVTDLVNRRIFFVNEVGRDIKNGGIFRVAQLERHDMEFCGSD